MSTSNLNVAAPNGRAARERSGLRTTGLVLILLCGLLLAASATVKFAGIPAVVQKMAAAGFGGPKLMFIGCLEMLSTALFLLPRTRSVGLLLVSAYVGGAICSHVQAGAYADAVLPSILLALAWTGTALRHPQMLWSLSDGLTARRS
jgi:hypothetical protein